MDVDFDKFNAHMISSLAALLHAGTSKCELSLAAPAAKPGVCCSASLPWWALIPLEL